MPYWQQAGQRALQRSANLEAVSHVTRGLEVLSTLPETRERAQQELALQIMLGAALGATKGQAAPEAERTYARACALARQVGSPPELFPALWGLWYAHMARGQLPRARELAEEFLELARQQHDPLLLVTGHRMVGNTARWQGDLIEAQAHCQQGLAFYDPEQHRVSAVSYGQDSGVACGILGAEALWMLGYPDQALRGMEETLALARRLAHPMSLAIALHFSAHLHQLRREPQAARTQAEAALALCTEQGFGPLWGLDPAPTGLGPRAAGRGGGGARPDPPGVCRLAGHGSWSGMAVVPGPVGRGLWQSRPARRGLARLRGGAGGGAAQRGAPLRGRGVSAQGRVAVAGLASAPGGGGGAFSAGPRCGPPPAGEVVGAASGDEPESPVAAAGQAAEAHDAAGADLRLVH